MNTLEDKLKRNAEQHSDKIAVVTAGATFTYGQLYERVKERAATLKHCRGKAIVFRNQQSVDFLVDYFAIHLAGAIAVPLEQGAPDERVDRLQAELDDTVFPDGVADILYTTGTTGASKGVMISHRAILADSENLTDALQFMPDVVFIICGPLNHIGSLSKIYPAIACAATLYLLEGMKDLNAFFHALDYPCRKMATFLVPANIRILIALAGQRLAGYADKIDFIETGAAPMSHSDMLAFCRLLPRTRLYNTYASTETGVISTYNYNDGRCKEGCLGRPMKLSRFIITEKGTIACQGDTLMTGYAGNPQLTREVLRGDTLYTSDYGETDSDGMLILKGREGDVINTGGFKVAPTEVEDVALTLPDVADCLCIATPHPIMGQALKLLVVMRAGQSLDARKMARYIASRLESYKVPVAYEQVDAIRRTFNGKVDRKYYRNHH